MPDIVIFLSGAAFGILTFFIAVALFDPKGGKGIR